LNPALVLAAGAVVVVELEDVKLNPPNPPVAAFVVAAPKLKPPAAPVVAPVVVEGAGAACPKLKPAPPVDALPPRLNDGAVVALVVAGV